MKPCFCGVGREHSRGQALRSNKPSRKPTGTESLNLAWELGCRARCGPDGSRCGLYILTAARQPRAVLQGMEWILPCLLGSLSHPMSWFPGPPGSAQHCGLLEGEYPSQSYGLVPCEQLCAAQPYPCSLSGTIHPFLSLCSRYRMPWDTLITTNAGQPGSRNRSKFFYKRWGGGPPQPQVLQKQEPYIGHNTSTASAFHVVLMVPPSPFTLGSIQTSCGGPGHCHDEQQAAQMARARERGP